MVISHAKVYGGPAGLRTFRKPDSSAMICSLLLLLFILLCPGRPSAQTVQWTKFADLTDSLRRESRPLLIFIHTDWCKYCALQKHNTFGDKAVSQWINENFYALQLNAESRETIRFLTRTYQGRSKAYHELAELLAKKDGQLSFPTTLILSERLQLQKRWTGFVSKGMLLEVGPN